MKAPASKFSTLQSPLILFTSITKIYNTEGAYKDCQTTGSFPKPESVDCSETIRNALFDEITTFVDEHGKVTVKRS